MSKVIGNPPIQAPLTKMMTPTLGEATTAWVQWFNEVRTILFAVQNLTLDGDRGDITVSAGGTTWTIDPGTVTLAKMADVATASFIGRTTAGTGVPERLSVTQATAMLDVFAGATKGLVPGGPGDASLLQANGTWTLTPSLTSLATTGNVTVGGVLKFGSYTVSAAPPITGYVQITDSGGTVRNLAVV